MRILYLECNMGAAGDMLMSALSELIDDTEDFAAAFNSIGLDGVVLESTVSVKCGIRGTHMKVKINGAEEDENIHNHHHSSLHSAEHIINALNISDDVKKNAISVYHLIAEAESHVHGKPIDKIHFHEVGTLDAVADIVGVCMLMEKLRPDSVIVSPIHVGKGSVKCAHGILPVPAPAVSYILKGVPIYSGETEGELCTPTGAALLKHFADEFRAMPMMKVLKIGYGMGKKDFPAANCVRAMLCESDDNDESISELVCNIDDMTGEEIGFAAEVLLNAGAADVFTSPIYMKKNRPGIILTCICKQSNKDKMLELIFKHTSTIGVREHVSKRYILNRREITLPTKYGNIRAKQSSGYGVTKSKFEYEDLSKAARENNLSIMDIKTDIT